MRSSHFVTNSTEGVKALSVVLALVGLSAPLLKAAVFADFSVSPSTTTFGATTFSTLSQQGVGYAVSLDVSVVQVGPQRQLRPITGTVGSPHSWYVVSQGTAFDPTWISTATPFASVPAGQPTSFNGSLPLTNGTVFFMGFWLDTGDNIPGAGDGFGWAKIQYTTSSGLVLLDTAVENSGHGIIVGTTTVVPEPSLHLLTAMGAAGLLFKRKRRD